MINLFHKAKLEPFDNLLIASEHNVTVNVEPSLLQQEEEEGAAHMVSGIIHAHMRSPTIPAKFDSYCGTVELGFQEYGHPVIFGYLGHV